MLSPLCVVGVTRGCNSHIFSNGTHIHSYTHLFIQRARIFPLSRLLFLTSFLFSFLCSISLNWQTISVCVYLWMQSEIGVCFEEQNTTHTQVHKYEYIRKQTAVIQTLLLRKSEHSMKINATPAPINDKWDFLLYVWTLNLAQTK